MRPPMSCLVRLRVLSVALALTACVRSSPVATEQDVRAFLAGVFDRPEARLSVPSVVIVGDYAVAGWVQSGHGGRTLLRRSAEGWEFMVCGGEDLLRPEGLVDAGLPESIAHTMSARVAKVESDLDPATRHLLGDFQGTMKMDGARHTPSK